MRILLAALAATLLLAGPAAAGTVSVRFSPTDFKTSGDRLYVTFEGGPEASRLEVRATGEEVRFKDVKPLQAGEGCAALSPLEVICRVRNVRTPRVIEARLGDGDDHASILGDRAEIDGEAGADTLTGGPRNDVLQGGYGADVVRGGDGDDELVAAEALAGEEPERLSGGRGRDVLTFERAHSPPVVADLAAGTARLGKTKALFFDGIEGVLGSLRADRISGGPGDDRVYGAGGNDVVDGRGGADVVSGGPGRDLVQGGPGADQLEVEDEDEEPTGEPDMGPDRLDCGAGDDKLTTVGPSDVVSLSCEEVVRHRLIADPRRPARAHFGLPRGCVLVGRCPARLSVRTGRGTLLLRRRFTDARSRWQPIRLGRAARAILRRERARQVVLRFARREEYGYYPTRLVIALP